METITVEAPIAPANRNTKKLYHYQESDITTLFEKIGESTTPQRLLYQLPTGGGKTVIFSEIAKRYIKKFHRKVVVLTHRKELCRQTATTLKNAGIANKAITSTVKSVNRKDQSLCYVAMVETLKNRIKSGQMDTDSVGLVIIDEAHHNSFQKLLGKFKNATVIGVTATPFSADINLPMKKNYSELIVGAPIGSLIEQGFLARPKTWRYDVELNSLITGQHGDYTVSSSDALYSAPAMLELLLHAYREHSKNKKTLIFNTGIFTSKAVCQMFTDAGYDCRHLDNKTSPTERDGILKWFKKTKGAILTSVSILTTGFDEPSVQTVILNRATNSLTLYHQMIGRGSRRLPHKKTFNIIDIGNNTDRFGEWNAPVDWKYVFENPDQYHESMSHHTEYESHTVPPEMRSKFPNSLEVSFDVQQAHHMATENGEKPKTVIRDSIRQHVLMCADNAETISEALHLSEELDKEINWRVKQYAKCLGKVTKNYTEWLAGDYKAKLRVLIQKIMHRRERLAAK
ncbi:DEAD/DEAH box helicase [Flavobacterium akiainvivens]|uniref:DEAD/DEAH box helicase n=1 Tax=Flavobacterium akiainvivens TaxID=1202724 RepID=A0A0M8M843_9FLAO|nr:DEAD/DEAH box helicase [Flavobacterium akiainvivens]KOS05453.1 DEAD/DEAH box helicase [Flavobacterium akiainvivens]SFQ32321.1 Superfamily II DNA or RNA helicase [Flavobacterium akiainvivens]